MDNKDDVKQVNSLERRKFIRHSTDIPLNVKKTGATPGQGHKLVDMSVGGICFESTESYDEGDIIRIAFPLLGEGREIEGEICWVKIVSIKFPQRFQYGIQFLHADDYNHVQYMERLCEEYSQGEAP